MVMLCYDVLLSDKAYNEYFKSKLEAIQYNAALPITVAIKDFSTGKIIRNKD